MKRPVIFRTFSALLSHIQAYSEPCETLAYAEIWHARNPGIFKTLPELCPDTYSGPCHIYENLWHLKPDTKWSFFFAKIVKNYSYFSKALHLRSLTEFWIHNLSISTHELLERSCNIYCMIHSTLQYSRPVQTYSTILWHI